jgi:hypothetical protein
MAVQVSELVRLAQRDADLRQSLESQPEQVAQMRQIPVLVALAASRALRTRPTEYGVWY